MTYGSGTASIIEVTTPPVARVTGPSLWLQEAQRATPAQRRFKPREVG